DLAPSALRLELTESSMMAARGTDAIHSLNEIGVSLSIDDFGTGFSSLSRLRRLPFSELKVDKSFVLQMQPGNNDEAIVRSVIEIARGLDKYVTAEGVETKAILDHLALLGCHSAQGYYLSRPVPADKCGSLLSAYRPRTPGAGTGATDLRR
ncbi:MAG TPA: EAL domain-containing protein, partial [Acidimicrobiales bacterium]|nr:EAL domain-containing protein [Acidimicrobiales bacterium]